MTRVTRAIILSTMFIVGPFTLAKEKTPPKSLPKPKIMTTLGVIDGESDGKTTAVTIRLDKKPSWEKVPALESHGTFLQLVLPDTIVPEPGKFFDIGTTLVSKVAVFQLTPSDAGIRFFVNNDAAKVQSTAETDLLDRRIILSINHKNLDKLVAEEPAKQPEADPNKANKTHASEELEADIPDYIDGLAKVESAESVIARVQVDRELAPPSVVLKANDTIPPLAPEPITEKSEVNPPIELFKNDAASTAPSVASTTTPSIEKPSRPLAAGIGIDLREKLVQTTLFFGSLIGLLLLSLTMRAFIRRRTRTASGDAPISMKMLGNLPLAARQKLSLVQVGDERILIGVTPEHVSFIANLSRQPAHAAGFSKLLAQTEIEPSPVRSDRALPTPPAPRPKLKDLPGNDELTLAEPPVHAPAPSRTPITKPEKLENKERTERADPAINSQASTARKKSTPQRVNIAVGDDGPRQVDPIKKPRQAENKPASREAVDDVTKMIREKLRQLKSI